jgi:ECF transporter S component (folate family)
MPNKGGIFMQKTADSPRFFKTPFSGAYWKCAASEFKSTRKLVIAAFFTALGLALKSVEIPVGASLNISVVFVVNALGGAIYGPLMALLSGAVSDVVGWMLFPKGPFFPPFTLVEMLAAFTYAVWLYRVRISVARAFGAKFSVNLFINVILTPICLSWMYGKAIMVYIPARIVKTGLLLIPEVVLMTLILQILLPVVAGLGWTPSQPSKRIPWI